MPQELCKHGLWPSWCGDCKHMTKEDFEKSTTERSVELVERLRGWAN